MQDGWQSRVAEHLPLRGAVVHAAAGCCRPRVGARGALAELGPVPYAAVLWAVGRGLPDEVVARSLLEADGRDRQTEAVLSWHAGPEAELLVASTATAKEWFVVTGTLGEVEVRPVPWTRGPGEVWVSDGSGTERHPFPATDLPRFADEEDVASVLDAVRRSAAAGGAPALPS